MRQDILLWLGTHFLPRWVLANVAGWALGLWLGAALLALLGGLAGAAISGVLAGLVVGGAQWLVLRQQVSWISLRWVWWSALGGGLAFLPAYLAGVALVAGPHIGYFVVGAVYGGIFGAAQWLVLRDAHDEWAGLWIMANLLAGGLCGCLTMTLTPAGLPLLCSPGPPLFGIITGGALRYMQNRSQ